MSQVDPPPKRRSKLRNLAVGMVLGSAIAILGIVAVLYLSRGQQLPGITFEILDAAVRQWSDAGPQDYEFDAELTGVNPSVVHVEAKNGQVTAMTVNGRPTKPHTWDDWSVPGLFGVIRRDLEVCMNPNNQAAKQTNGADANSAQAEVVVPRGTFDPKLGYPTQYHRVTPTGQDAKWRITRFEAK
jgi:hypothetical protein